MIGLGVITYQRPEFFNKTIASIEKHLLGVADYICVCNDDDEANALRVGYDYSSLSDGIEVGHLSQNSGVATAKNWCLKNLMDHGADWLFICEDDLNIRSPGAITEYIEVSQATGCQHLMFAHHGRANESGPIESCPESNYELFAFCVGAWALYTRETIETVGYMDEGFRNAYEHVEHTFRIFKAGLMTPIWQFMDVFDSTRLIQEQPLSLEHSTIRRNPNWIQSLKGGLDHWRSIDPDCPL